MRKYAMVPNALAYSTISTPWPVSWIKKTGERLFGIKRNQTDLWQKKQKKKYEHTSVSRILSLMQQANFTLALQEFCLDTSNAYPTWSNVPYMYCNK